ncbi:tryptophan-rich sensory protein [Chromohalobacter salexigens]|uniref:TspO/MBR family protein n=1 Tax=Chromohalobacter canadensis TaxID=141389 RepID=UPI0015BE9D72|nr:TspO/MBR family protein [Chromohalobacter canadensis]MCT8468928.1 tryptophan-rich sensory protein [Chromohalobacter canadensis]MCT8472882.1 tryptophan-rich sensory protein [Chromohalobacter canadensis]MCT8500334.1 tryptophan-rich sensory protein [Chromohalobacter canadensis]NWO09774.1 tryptophan-rich sensory protein [Chromohalobacter salexigens]
MHAISTRHQALGLIGWLVLSFITAGIGAIASVDATQFYAELTQPSWAPPAGAFGPVWTTLFALMGIAAWLVWREGGWKRQQGVLALFIVHLAVNALWSWLFFAWHQGALAFVEVILLWGMILATLIAFWRVRPLAGLLLVPYLAWVSLATALTYTVWQLNPQLLG